MIKNTNEKTLEYFYIFKIKHIFILLICLIVLGYFFISFQNQENSKNEQEDMIKLEENSKIISNIVTKISTNDIVLVK